MHTTFGQTKGNTLDAMMRGTASPIKGKDLRQFTSKLLAIQKCAHQLGLAQVLDPCLRFVGLQSFTCWLHQSMVIKTVKAEDHPLCTN